MLRIVQGSLEGMLLLSKDSVVVVDGFCRRKLVA